MKGEDGTAYIVFVEIHQLVETQTGPDIKPRISSLFNIDLQHQAPGQSCSCAGFFFSLLRREDHSNDLIVHFLNQVSRLLDCDSTQHFKAQGYCC
jgi:hypothetical protein